jgi:hypothetical protein
MAAPDVFAEEKIAMAVSSYDVSVVPTATSVWLYSR